MVGDDRELAAADSAVEREPEVAAARGSVVPRLPADPDEAALDDEGSRLRAATARPRSERTPPDDVFRPRRRWLKLSRTGGRDQDGDGRKDCVDQEPLPRSDAEASGYGWAADGVFRPRSLQRSGSKCWR